MTSMEIVMPMLGWLEQASAEEVLDWTHRTFESPVLVASFQAESCVLIDMAVRLGWRPQVLTLDTGRLPQETFEVIDQVRERYDLEVQIVSPDADQLRRLVAPHGPNLFYLSPQLRRLCCRVRKSDPLRRALAGHDAWVTGLRRDQAPTRADTPVVAPDPDHGGIAKVAPLAGWTWEQVLDYVRRHRLPHHPLYERGYTSIGCAPCTRPIRPGEDARAGRWWWEQGEAKECGLHQPVPGSWRAGR